MFYGLKIKIKNSKMEGQTELLPKYDFPCVLMNLNFCSSSGPSFGIQQNKCHIRDQRHK